MMTKTLIAAAAALTLSACGDAGEQIEDLRAEASAVVNERALTEAVSSAVDVDAARAIAEGAAKEALREALPGEEIGAATAILDEKALVEGVGKAVDEEALGNAVNGVVALARDRVTPSAEE